MKENVLVTLADEKNIDQAKQLFASAYWNGGWSGDYMLLAYKVPEEKSIWFRDKGIFIKNVSAPPISIKEKNYSSSYPPITLAKFYVFTPEFKRWKHIIFLDSDIIVKANLNKLTAVKGFGAVTDMLPFIESQIDDYAQTTIKVAITNSKAFNSGVFCFSTDIITKDTFQKICALAGEYVERTMYFPDQAILNVFFYKNWTRIPFLFNLYYLTLPRRYQNNPSKIKCAVLHFAGKYKPWDTQSPCYQEWIKNLRLADAMDLNKVRRGRKYSFSIFSILYYRYLRKIEFVYFYSKLMNKITKRIGLLVGYLKKDIVLGRGWYVLEYHDLAKRFFIWNSRQSEIFINSDRVTGVKFDVMLSPFNKKTFTVEAYDKNSLVMKRTYRASRDIVHVHINAKTTKIMVSNPAFIPAYQEGNSRDIRKLGIMLMSPIIVHKKAKIIPLHLNRVASYKYLHKIKEVLDAQHL